jgi:hypothetical protein
MLHALPNSSCDRWYCHVYEVWLYTGFGLVIGFTGHLQIVTTSKYSAIINSHTQQFVTARTKSSHSAVSSPVVAWWRILTMSSASVFAFYAISSVLCPFIILNTLSWNLSSLRSSLNERDQVPHPYETTHKVIAFCTLIFTFLDRRNEDESFLTVMAAEIFPNVICFQFFCDFKFDSLLLQISDYVTFWKDFIFYYWAFKNYLALTNVLLVAF